MNNQKKINNHKLALGMCVYALCSYFLWWFANFQLFFICKLVLVLLRNVYNRFWLFLAFSRNKFLCIDEILIYSQTREQGARTKMSSAAPTPQLIGTPSTGATAPSSSSSSSSSGPSSATTTTTTSNSGATTSQQPAQTQQQLVKSYTASLLRHLQALGFDAQAVGEKHNIVFNHVMFIKPNSKGFELIVQFLLTQLDPERASRIFVPLCKEAMKEFKDAIFNWLNELATTSSGGSVGSQMSSGVSGKSVGGGGGGGGGGAGQSQTAMPLWSNPTHMRLFHLIRFPTVTRSLLTVPCGLKACEVLYALLTHVALAKAIRLSKFFFF